MEIKRHNGEECPVPGIDRVTYRAAINGASGTTSKWHVPIAAYELDWSFKPSIGRIYDYIVLS
jgi:hypothetical protein